MPLDFRRPGNPAGSPKIRSSTGRTASRAARSSADSPSNRLAEAGRAFLPHRDRDGLARLGHRHRPAPDRALRPGDPACLFHPVDDLRHARRPDAFRGGELSDRLSARRAGARAPRSGPRSTGSVSASRRIAWPSVRNRLSARSIWSELTTSASHPARGHQNSRGGRTPQRPRALGHTSNVNGRWLRTPASRIMPAPPLPCAGDAGQVLVDRRPDGGHHVCLRAARPAARPAGCSGRGPSPAVAPQINAALGHPLHPQRGNRPGQPLAERCLDLLGDGIAGDGGPQQRDQLVVAGRPPRLAEGSVARLPCVTVVQFTRCQRVNACRERPVSPSSAPRLVTEISASRRCSRARISRPVPERGEEDGVERVRDSRPDQHRPGGVEHDIAAVAHQAVLEDHQ